MRTAHLASPFLITYVSSGARACLACIVRTAAAHVCWPHTGMSDAVVTHCPQRTLQPVLEAPNKKDISGHLIRALWQVLGSLNVESALGLHKTHTHTEERKKANYVTFKQFRKTAREEAASGQGVRDEPESLPQAPVRMSAPQLLTLF